LANTASAAKRARQSEKRRIRNRLVRTRMRNSVRRARLALETGDREAAQSVVQQACRELDKAAQKGVIHQNTAARTKSRLARKLNTL
jgi:small subunit ribosomal protein S20